MRKFRLSFVTDIHMLRIKPAQDFIMRCSFLNRAGIHRLLHGCKCCIDTRQNFRLGNGKRFVCRRRQFLDDFSFLWRAAGSPEPETRTMPFTDVPAGSYYYDAVLWAVENGITEGTSDTTFSPNATCSRAQIVTFLWRSEKSPAAGTANPFADVKSTAYYAGAVLWAVREDITKGTTSTTFSPDTDCTRAQIVTFLWRCKK